MSGRPMASPLALAAMTVPPAACGGDDPGAPTPPPEPILGRRGEVFAPAGIASLRESGAAVAVGPPRSRYTACGELPSP